jgi:hypothetical protein
MTEEKRRWLEQTANVIDQLVYKFHYSVSCVSIETGNEFFEDSCNYVQLVSELRNFSGTLRSMIKYSELGEEKPVVK